MAWHIKYLILVAFFLVTTTATISDIDEKEDLVNCSKHMGPHCGNQVIDTLSSDEKTMIPASCCYKLIQTGYSCHFRLTRYILQYDSKFKNANATEILSKNFHIYHRCDELTKPASQEFLTECMDQLGAECGTQVFEKLLLNENITKHCCKKFVEMGRPCNVNLVKALVRAPKMRDVDALELMNKSKKLYDQCRNWTITNFFNQMNT
ncbi:hypothetical protein VNO78_06433 [Psophocarpus tetragonolobus]|uniref:Prolamin-like domain-containing protein n=1 Tax=Psophocarpus tetragonolobus TaxID=3891 RepID=A0AAN9XRU9_PSOTE